MTTVLVTGGSGLLGRAVVDRLTASGHSVRVLSRTTPAGPAPSVHALRGDLHTGGGLAQAVTEAEVIVHCASDPRRPQDVDVAGTVRLLAAARRAGRPHLVYISIVGADRIPWAYYRAKVAAEGLIAESGLPWTTLRSTQFHEFSLSAVRRLTRSPLVPVVRGWRFQPVDVGEVADRLVAGVAAGPAGRVPDLGGPEVLGMAELVRDYLTAAGDKRVLVPLAVPGGFSAAFRAGANLAPAARAGGQTWTDFLASSVPARRQVASARPARIR
ncbi:SDR family oxidoreductase [Geodermatophilus sp. CPCC 206100]|uniref:SDR family oxidoreductase n=1 Tax=Geodermatophilus sp. CPCC 206100 TaxID=3020054 RepID=UPI003AFFCDAB